MARLSIVESTALAEFARALGIAFGPRLASLTLFGSRARGEGRDDSDLDVLVLVRGMTSADRRVAQDTGFDVGLRHRLVISPLVADADTWRPELPLAMTISREGRPL